MVTKSYAGAAWNQLMENETKESIAKMYLDSLDIRRDLLEALREAALQIAYLHERWQPTGSGNAVLERSRAIISKAEGKQP